VNAAKCTTTISRSLINIKVIDQRSRSHGLLCFFVCIHITGLEQGFHLSLFVLPPTTARLCDCQHLSVGLSTGLHKKLQADLAQFFRKG